MKCSNTKLYLTPSSTDRYSTWVMHSAGTCNCFIHNKSHPHSQPLTALSTKILSGTEPWRCPESKPGKQSGTMETVSVGILYLGHSVLLWQNRFHFLWNINSLHSSLSFLFLNPPANVKQFCSSMCSEPMWGILRASVVLGMVVFWGVMRWFFCVWLLGVFLEEVFWVVGCFGFFSVKEHFVFSK